MTDFPFASDAAPRPARIRPSRFSPRLMIVGICAAMLVIGGLLLWSVLGEMRAREQAQRTTQVLGLLRDGLRAGIDAETGQRGYLLTGDASYLVPYTAGSQAWLPELDALGALLGPVATPEQTEALDRMRLLAQAKLDELALTVELARKGRLDDALAVVRSNEGRDLMREVRQIVDQLERTEAAILEAALNDAAAIEARVLPILGLLGMVILTLVLIGFALERRSATAVAAAREAGALRRANAQSDLLVRELNHRVKNLFAVILSIISLSGRSQTDARVAVRSIRDRVHALSLAHAVSQGQIDVHIVSLEGVLEATLAPYETAAHTGRVLMEGEAVTLPARAITPLGMIVHELATNAAKYGALSTETGTVALRWSRTATAGGARVVLEWNEAGGPAPSENRKDGFGSLMMRHAATQLGGAVTRSWTEQGLRAEIDFEIREDSM